jgi:ABC-type uncharacterized transport system ATPase subunit
MCPVKTENLSVNVAREEGAFWREMVAVFGARSRGDLQKMLLFEGLKALNGRAAKRLRAIRLEFGSKQFLAAAMVLVFCGGLLAAGGNHHCKRLLRGPRAKTEQFET